MVEAFAVASGKGGTGKTTSTLALGLALAETYDVTVVDADTEMANLLFHAGLDDADVTLHDLLLGERDIPVADACYERFGLTVVPCGTDLAGFREADPTRLHDVIAELAADTDVLLLDSPAALDSAASVLPIVLADRVVLVTQPTVPALSDALKVQEYATSYGTGVAGVLFNKVRPADAIERITPKAERYFEGPIIGAVPDDDAARAARRAGQPLLAYAPDSPAAAAYRDAAAAIDVDGGEVDALADRFRSAVIPDPVKPIDSNRL
ncbi:septum site-determining protein MinD [Halarchaeum solikamskense]|uniref:nucleotide-binding protein n=1 Tax=Halarchaeum nitratireducens TaxID=489913 RepID=UPI001B3B0BCE|nr:AAA family ATPase [Halarchaeum solikamskense]MBP2251626.1 septum site-determining protein MinD [Halarchaeum solikamskense]